jgi:diguanylate cyclase (GGDEF)-like protein
MSFDADLVALVGLLAESLSLQAPVSPVVEQLRTLARPDAEPPTSEDLVKWREQVTALIDDLRASREARRQKALAAVMAARLDKATGLPGSSTAQAEIERAAAREEPPLIAVLVLDQLRVLNARFGRNVGDDVLAFAASELSRQLSDAGALYRWNGPAFVLISSLSEAKRQELESRLNQLAASRIDKTIEVEERSIHVKVTFSWHVHALAPSESVIQITRILDDAVAATAATKT